jgi:hypothetical protein
LGLGLGLFLMSMLMPHANVVYGPLCVLVHVRMRCECELQFPTLRACVHAGTLTEL